MLKWLIMAVLLVALYLFLTSYDAQTGADAALVITAFAGLYGLFMLSFVLHDRN